MAVRGAPALRGRGAREAELDEARALSAGLGALAELRELARAAAEFAPADGPALAQSLERVEVFSGQRPHPGGGGGARTVASAARAA